MNAALARYLEKWALADPEPLALTATSDLYTVTHEGAPAVLKILSPLGATDEKDGAQALLHFNGLGAVQLFRHDEGAHLIEFAGGGDLTSLVRDGHDATATAIIGDVLNELHRMPARDVGGLRPLRSWFRALFDRAGKPYADPLLGRAAIVVERLLDNARDVCVLHGDIHHENIRQNARGWLALDPKGLAGERTFDAANALCNPLSLPALTENRERLMTQAKILAEKMEADPKRLLAFVFVYAALSASFSIQDGDDPGHALRMAALAEPHIGGF